MTKTKFHLCKDGYTLYLAWSKLLDSKAERALITAAKKAYIFHRKTCTECSEFLNIFRDNADNS